MRVLPAGALAASGTPASDVARILFGSIGAKLIAASILVSIFGALNGYILTGARVPYAMGTDGLLPGARWWGQLHSRYQTPANSLILVGILAVAYILTGSFDRLTNLAVFVLWIFFVMALVAVFILRIKQPDLKRPYKVPLYPLVPIVGIAGGLYILASTLFTSTADSLLGLGITAAGLPVYWLIRERK
jgi:APA family basic amino acid/polyamine antiporter